MAQSTKRSQPTRPYLHLPYSLTQISPATTPPRETISDNVLMFNGSPVAWLSTKQGIQALHTTQTTCQPQARCEQPCGYGEYLHSRSCYKSRPQCAPVAIQVAQKTAGTKKRNSFRFDTTGFARCLSGGRSSCIMSHPAGPAHKSQQNVIRRNYGVP